MGMGMQWSGVKEKGEKQVKESGRRLSELLDGRVKQVCAAAAAAMVVMSAVEWSAIRRFALEARQGRQTTPTSLYEGDS